MNDGGVEIDSTIVAGGETPFHVAPTKSATLPPYRWVFTGWTPTLEAAVSNTTYTATFKMIADLALVESDWTAADGDEIVGETDYNVTIPGYVHVTINGVSVTGTSGTNTVVETNFVDVAVMTTNAVELVLTNVIDMVVVQTNVVGIAAEAAVVPAGVKDFVPSVAFSGADKLKMNGIVFDEDDTMWGIIQVETAKASAKGVKVKGFVMLEDGKKVAIKAVTVPIEGGRLYVETSVGKLGNISLTVGSDGFMGDLGAMKVVSADIGEDAGVLTGSLTLKYLDGTGKMKSKRIAIGGVATGGTAAGTATTKGWPAKVFAAEFE